MHKRFFILILSLVFLSMGCRKDLPPECHGGGGGASVVAAESHGDGAGGGANSEETAELPGASRVDSSPPTDCPGSPCRGGGCKFQMDSRSGQLNEVYDPSVPDEVLEVSVPSEDQAKLEKNLSTTDGNSTPYVSYVMRDPKSGISVGVRGDAYSYESKDGTLRLKNWDAKVEKDNRPFIPEPGSEPHITSGAFSDIAVVPPPGQTGASKSPAPEKTKELPQKDYDDQTKNMPPPEPPTPDSQDDSSRYDDAHPYDGNNGSEDGDYRTAKENWDRTQLAQDLKKLESGLHNTLGEISGKNKKKRDEIKERIENKISKALDLKGVVDKNIGEINDSIKSMKKTQAELSKLEDEESSPQDKPKTEAEKLAEDKKQHNQLTDQILSHLPNMDSSHPPSPDKSSVLTKVDNDCSLAKMSTLCKIGVENPKYIKKRLHGESQKINAIYAYADFARDQISNSDMPHKNDRLGMVDFAEGVIGSADAAYEGGDSDTGDLLAELAYLVLDVAVDSTLEAMGLGWARSTFELVTGVNLLTGEELTTEDRVMATIGVATYGLGRIANNISKIAKVAKAVEEGGKVSKTATKSARVINSAKDGKWSTVFESGYKPKDMIENKAFLDKFRKDKKIPNNWETGPAKKGDGISFSKPGTAKADEIRIKEGIPNSNYPNSREPNIRLKKDGKWRDINGNEVPLKSEESHIPIDGFKFPDWF